MYYNRYKHISAAVNLKGRGCGMKGKEKLVEKWWEGSREWEGKEVRVEAGGKECKVKEKEEGKHK